MVLECLVDGSLGKNVGDTLVISLVSTAVKMSVRKVHENKVFPFQ
jgi:hypothetical protein